MYRSVFAQNQKSPSLERLVDVAMISLQFSSLTVMCVMCHAYVNEIRIRCQIFDEVDEGQKGWLSRQDFKVGLVSLLGYKPSKFEINKHFPKGKPSPPG
jgi:hypothetical protein